MFFIFNKTNIPDTINGFKTFVEKTDIYRKTGYICNDIKIMHSFNDRPSFELADLSLWCKNGFMHRLDRPAIIRWFHNNERICEWYENGELHRIDGPAVYSQFYNPLSKYFKTKYSNLVNPEWYIKGVNITARLKPWISENNFPVDTDRWSNDHKMIFKLTFC